MPDEELTPTPEEIGTTDESTVEDQPQVDVETTPDEGTTVEDDQPIGTTDPAVRKDKEELYQTKYQKLKPEYDKAMAELDAIGAQYAPPSEPETPSAPPASQLGEPEQPEYYDLSSREGVDILANVLTERVTGQIMSGLSDRDRRIAEQARLRAGWEAVGSKLGDWRKDNGVSEEDMARAVQDVASDFPNCSAAALGKYAIKRVHEMAAQERHKQRLAQDRIEAAKKSKDLAGVEQPAPGTSTPLKAGDEKELADIIAPDNEYTG